MKLRHYLALIAAALILLGSFFLPNAVAGITDMRTLGALTMIDSQSISFDLTPELSVPERIALAASPNTEMLPVITGNSMDEKAAGNRAAHELSLFFQGDAFELDHSEMTVSEGSAALIIDTAAPEQNMIIWEFDLSDPAGNSVTVTIDDETGVIVRLIYISSDWSGAMFDSEIYRSADGQFFEASKILTEMMTEYFGIPVALSDYKYSGNLSYYRADIKRGGLVVPMYGVVRAASFTINERLY